MNWRDLNKYLKAMKEEDIWLMLEKERHGARRRTVLARLHQRYSALRTARERAHLMTEAIDQ